MSKLSFEKIKFDKPLDNSLDLSDLLLNIFSKGFNGALNEFIRQVSPYGGRQVQDPAGGPLSGGHWPAEL